MIKIIYSLLKVIPVNSLSTQVYLTTLMKKNRQKILLQKKVIIFSTHTLHLQKTFGKSQKNLLHVPFQDLIY